MANDGGSRSWSASNGRYVPVKIGSGIKKMVGVGMTKERLARVERSWRRASEETGAFKSSIKLYPAKSGKA